VGRSKRPVTLGERVRVEIEALAMGGDGVARVDDYVLFVPGTTPGDTVSAEVTETRATYGKARVVTVHDAGSARVEPACAVYQQCGGCQRIGHLAHPEVLPTLGMNTPWTYRNKAQFPATVSGSKMVFGFYRRGSHEVVPTEQCPVQDPLLTRILGSVSRVANRLGWTAYDEDKHEGLLRHVVVRSTGWAPRHGTLQEKRQALLVLVINGEQLPREKDAARLVRSDCPEVVGVVKSVNRERTNRILGSREEVIEGQGYIVDTLGSLSFRISAGSFYQVNPLQTLVLYGEAVRAAKLGPADRVLDVFCGIGTISLYAAMRCRSITGIEVVESAVRDASANARMNGIDNAEFMAGRAEDLLPLMRDQGEDFDVVFVDPPRKGLSSGVLDALVELRPERLVYVSCNPTTLARDVARLNRADYTLGRVQPVDMFPHTTHVECVVGLTAS